MPEKSYPDPLYDSTRSVRVHAARACRARLWPFSRSASRGRRRMVAPAFCSANRSSYNFCTLSQNSALVPKKCANLSAVSPVTARHVQSDLGPFGHHRQASSPCTDRRARSPPPRSEPLRVLGAFSGQPAMRFFQLGDGKRHHPGRPGTKAQTGGGDRAAGLGRRHGIASRHRLKRSTMRAAGLPARLCLPERVHRVQYLSSCRPG